MEGFRRLQRDHSYLGDVRGKGLMIGLEIVEDRYGNTPAPQRARFLQGILFRNRLIVGAGGVHGNVLRLSPPLTLTDDQIEQTLSVFQQAFTMVCD